MAHTPTKAILTLKSYINSKLNDESNQEIVQYLSAVLLRKWFLHSIAQELSVACILVSGIVQRCCSGWTDVAKSVLTKNYTP